MQGNAINLALRFILELTALLLMGMWGWQVSIFGIPYVAAIVVPLLLAALWGIFAVPNDPSRSGKAPVPVPGYIRLAFEMAFFGFAVFCCHSLGYILLSKILGGVILLHYLLWLKRIRWLLKA